MKYRIKKLQGGGMASFTPILDQMPAGAVRPQSSTETKKEGLMDEDVYKKLISEGGLTNDVNLFVQQLEGLESDPLGFGNQGNVMSTYRLIGKVNELIRNKKTHDAALASAKDQKAVNEVAIDTRGNMYTIDNGKIGTISLSAFKKAKNKPSVLSVGELMNHREFMPDLAMNTSIFEVAKNAAGMELITDRIRNMTSLMKEFANNTEDHYSKKEIMAQMAAMGGIKKPTSAQIEAFQSLMKIGDTPGDYFKVVRKDSKNGRDVNKTLDYIYSTLNRQQQLKLEATAAMNGDRTSKEYIFDMLKDYEGIKSTFEVSPEDNPADGAGSADKNMKPLTPWQLFHKGLLKDDQQQFNLNNPDASIRFRGLMGSVGALYDEKGNNITMNTMNTVLNGYGLNRILESGNVYFGDKKVDAFDVNNIIYDGQDVAQVYMPTNPDGSVDFDSLDEFKAIYSVYDANKDSWSTAQAEKHFKTNGYNLKIDEQGGEKAIRANAYVKPYMVMYGFTSDATKLTKDNKWATELTKQEEKAWVPLLERIWTVGTGKNQENLTPNKSWNIEDYYKAAIMIPYRKDYAAYVDSIQGQGPLAKQSTILDAQRNIRYSSNAPMNTNVGAKILNNGN